MKGTTASHSGPYENPIHAFEKRRSSEPRGRERKPNRLEGRLSRLACSQKDFSATGEKAKGGDPGGHTTEARSAR